MRSFVAWVLIVGYGVACGAWCYRCGHEDGRRQSQGRAVNGLLSVGFRVVDPEGYPVERFEE